METAKSRTYVVVILLLIVTIICLKTIDPPYFVDTRPIGPLPDKIEGYTTDTVIFCHRPTCLNSGLQSETDNQTCPKCEEKMQTIALGEKMLLSEDTITERKIYTDPRGCSFLVTVIISGKHRTDIHSPQVCLKGQGYEILDEHQTDIQINDSTPLKATLLALRKNSAHFNGDKYLQIYWFASPDYETPSHFKRLFFTASDNLIKGIACRWAYITVMTPQCTDELGTIEKLKSFTANLYPIIIRKYKP